MESYTRTTATAEKLAEQDRVFQELTQRTRELISAVMTTNADAAEVTAVASEIAALTDRLGGPSDAGSLGVQITSTGAFRNHGNAVVGLRNPCAVPLHIQRLPEGRALSSFRLGAPHEGPPHLVHGGVSALILDQMLGAAAAAGGSPGMTSQLKISYVRPTPLGELTAEAWITEVAGYRTIVHGHIKDPEDRVTVEAEGLFILPRWAREALDRAHRPPSFE